MQGHELTNTLFYVFCCFRLDVINRNFYDPSTHCDYRKFLLTDDDGFTKPPVNYSMTVYLLGASSSLGCANFGLKYVTERSRSEFGHDVAKFVKYNFYANVVLTSMFSHTTNLCKKGSIRCYKCTSNSPTIIKAIPNVESAES